MASSAGAATMRVTPGDRLVVRSDGGTTSISGAQTDAITANAPIGRAASDPHLIEIVASDSLTITLPRSVPVTFRASGKADATIRDVASLEAHAPQGRVSAVAIHGNVIATSGNSNISVDGVEGLVDVTTGNGIVTIANVRRGVRVVSINGKTNVSHVGGEVNVRDTSGSVVVSDTQGDVDVFTALGRAQCEGKLVPLRSYRLKTLDGAVSLLYARDGAGFTAHLASDGGQLDLDPSFRVADKARRVDLKSGDESARIVLDAVAGRVVLKPLGR